MKKPTLLSLIFLSLSVALLAQQAQWRGAERDGKYTDTGLLKSWPEAGPELLWKISELGRGQSVSV